MSKDTEQKDGGKTKSSSSIQELATMDAVESFLKNNDYVVIKFGMPGCGPCKTVAPAFEKLPERLGKLSLASVDATCPDVFDLVDQYTVDKVPVFHFFHRSKHQPDLTYRGINADKLWKRAHTLSHLK